MGDYEEAKRWCESAVSAMRRQNMQIGLANAFHELAIIEYAIAGDADRWFELGFRESREWAIRVLCPDRSGSTSSEPPAGRRKSRFSGGGTDPSHNRVATISNECLERSAPLRRERQPGRHRSGRSTRWRDMGQAEMAEDAFDRLGFEHHRQHPAAPAARAAQDVHEPDPLHQLGPGHSLWPATLGLPLRVGARGLGSRAVAVTARRLLLTAPRNDLVASGCCWGEYAVVRQDMKTRRRDQRREPGEERQRIHDDRLLAVSPRLLEPVHDAAVPRAVVLVRQGMTAWLQLDDSRDIAPRPGDDASKHRTDLPAPEHSELLAVLTSLVFNFCNQKESA